MSPLARLNLETPVVQAGMAGVARGELAGAVSRAGGLGTIGLLPVSEFRAEIRRARKIAGDRPIAANLLLPFARREHLQVCIDEHVAAVSLFFGFRPRWVERLRESGIVVLHQVGTPAQARRALADGAEILIAQGLEAGGHLLATDPLEAFLPEAVRIAGQKPVIAAGGIHDGRSTARVMAAGAQGVALGTRFLLTTQSFAHPEYKRRLLAAKRSVVTRLYGFGWPARHRVVPNAAFERWCDPPNSLTAIAMALERLSGPLGRILPISIAGRLARLQSVRSPIFSPALTDAGMPERLVDVTPLYAGGCVEHIHELIDAEEVVRIVSRGMPS